MAVRTSNKRVPVLVSRVEYDIMLRLASNAGHASFSSWAHGVLREAMIREIGLQEARRIGLVLDPVGSLRKKS